MTAQPVPHLTTIDRATFETVIKPGGTPVIFKGLAAHWPIVQAAKQSPQALGNLLQRYDTGLAVPISVAPPSVKGHFFYNRDMTGVNYDTHDGTLSQIVGWCLSVAGQPNVDAIYLQAQPVDRLAPALVRELAMPLLDAEVRPRMWVGNTLRTQTHFDYAANIAVHVAGKKTFTLFDPDQTGNLYPGPLDLTPAGVPVSMAPLENPDFARFPRLKTALESAHVAELEPGDALYIPPLWWHHVETTGPLNLLINYWWQEEREDVLDPVTALNIAALSWKTMPATQRAAWRELVNYFVFEDTGDPVAHLPAHIPSAFRPDLSREDMRRFRDLFLRSI